MFRSFSPIPRFNRHNKLLHTTLLSTQQGVQSHTQFPPFESPCLFPQKTSSGPPVEVGNTTATSLLLPKELVLNIYGDDLENDNEDEEEAKGDIIEDEEEEDLDICWKPKRGSSFKAQQQALIESVLMRGESLNLVQGNQQHQVEDGGRFDLFREIVSNNGSLNDNAAFFVGSSSSNNINEDDENMKG